MDFCVSLYFSLNVSKNNAAVCWGEEIFLACVPMEVLSNEVIALLTSNEGEVTASAFGSIKGLWGASNTFSWADGLLSLMESCHCGCFRRAWVLNDSKVAPGPKQCKHKLKCRFDRVWCKWMLYEVQPWIATVATKRTQKSLRHFRDGPSRPWDSSLL